MGSLDTFLIMFVAIVVNKITIAIGESFGPFALRELNFYGFWSMTHEMRTDFAMFLGSIFLMTKGGRRWSIDRMIQNQKDTRNE